MSHVLHRVALASALATLASVAAAATAGVTTDHDGNTGYATPEACDAAIQSGKAKFYKHLADWNRLSVGDTKRLVGVTGASVGAGRTLKVTAELADALIDAGYEIRIDAAAEDMRDSPSDIRVPLTTQNAGKSQAGKQYVQTLTYQLK